MGLAERAATLAAGSETFDGAGAQAGYDAPLPDLDIADPDPDGYPQIPVHLAWLRVRADIKKIAKDDYNQNQKYNFRGIDAALNAFGPTTLKHGVNVLPHRIETSFRDARTSQGKPARECTVTVTWRVYGPTGDFFESQTAGESLDSGDKGSSKAQAVALRTLLLNGGLIPTGDPAMDGGTVERGEAPVRGPASYLDEVLNPTTSVGRLRQIHKEVVDARLAGALVANEHGQEEELGALVIRVGKERKKAPADPWSNALPAHDGHDGGEYSAECAACKAESAAADREMAGVA